MRFISSAPRLARSPRGLRRTASGEALAAAVLGLLLIFSLIRSELLAAAVAWGPLVPSTSSACGARTARSPGSVLLPFLLPPLALAVVLSITFAAGGWAPRFRTPKTTRHLLQRLRAWCRGA